MLHRWLNTITQSQLQSVSTGPGKSQFLAGGLCSLEHVSFTCVSDWFWHFCRGGRFRPHSNSALFVWLRKYSSDCSRVFCWSYPGFIIVLLFLTNNRESLLKALLSQDPRLQIRSECSHYIYLPGHTVCTIFWLLLNSEVTDCRENGFSFTRIENQSKPSCVSE